MFKQIETTRQQKGMTIIELCKLANCKVRSYYDWKANKSSPSISKFIKLCNALNLNININ